MSQRTLKQAEHPSSLNASRRVVQFAQSKMRRAITCYNESLRRNPSLSVLALTAGRGDRLISRILLGLSHLPKTPHSPRTRDYLNHLPPPHPIVVSSLHLLSASS